MLIFVSRDFSSPFEFFSISVRNRTKWYREANAWSLSASRTALVPINWRTLSSGGKGGAGEFTARIAEVAGYDLAVLPGSLASAAVLGVPDLIVLTLTEFAEQARRIARYSQLALIADADHGYGNALNVQRTVEELENAGVAGLTLEDTRLPAAFGTAEPMVSIPEMTARLRAAVAARRDPDLVLIGRTNAFNVSGTEDAVARLTAYAATGVDAVIPRVGSYAVEYALAIVRQFELMGVPVLNSAAAATARQKSMSKNAPCRTGHIRFRCAW